MRRMMIGAMALCLLAGGAQAAMLGAGTRELALEGSLDTDGANGTELDLSVGYGYFVMDCVEILGEVALFSSDDVKMYGLGGTAEYNIDMGTQIVPFVGVGAGFMKVEVDNGGDFDEDAFVLGADLGVKYFIVDNVAVSGSFFAQWATEDIYPEEDEMSDMDYGLQVGLRFFF